MSVKDKGEDATTRRDRAVARVLDPARERAETRVQRFLDAALELMRTSSGADFSVQEVVEKSGQSLRSFYQYFDGKYELLLALLEDSTRSTADSLEKMVQDESTPMARLRRFSVEYYAMCRPIANAKANGKYRPSVALGEFAQQLLTEHPAEASRAFIPLVTLLERLIEDAVKTGEITDAVPVRRIAGLFLQAIMFSTFGLTIAGELDESAGGGDAAEELWGVLLHGFTSTGDK